MDYSVSYDLIKNNGNVISEVRGTACFADLFNKLNSYGNISYRTMLKYDKIKVYFWLLNTENNLEEDADWFIEHFILTHLPDRIKKDEVFSYYKKKEVMNEELISRFSRNFKDLIDYWITLEVDLNKITANDLYILLMLFRYPQENPKLPSFLRDMVIMYPNIPVENLFGISHLEGSHQNFGHLIPHSSSLFMIQGCNDPFTQLKFPFKKSWETYGLLNGKDPANKRNTKTSNSDYFKMSTV